MPTMNKEILKTLPMQSRCTMTLEEIRNAMIEEPPNLEKFRGGGRARKITSQISGPSVSHRQHLHLQLFQWQGLYQRC